MIGIWQHQSLRIGTSTTIIHRIYHTSVSTTCLYQQMMEHTHLYQNIPQVHPIFHCYYHDYSHDQVVHVTVHQSNQMRRNHHLHLYQIVRYTVLGAVIGAQNDDRAIISSP